MAHAGSDAAVTLDLPASDRKLAVPGHQQLLLGLRQGQVIAVVHVEVDPRQHAFHGVPGLGDPPHEVHLEVTRTVLPARGRQHLVAVVAPVAVDLADARYDVVEVGLHEVEERVALLAAGPTAVLPALPGPAEVFGGYHVFPLEPGGPLGLGTHLVAAALQIDAATGRRGPVPVTPAVGVALGTPVLVRVDGPQVVLRRLVGGGRPQRRGGQVQGKPAKCRVPPAPAGPKATAA